MARLLVIVAIVQIALMCIVAEEFTSYPDQYDYINITEILANDKIREQYYKCMTDTGPCRTADAKFYKSIIGDIIATNCKKCNERQKDNLDKIADWYTKNEPEKWHRFVEKIINDLKAKNTSR